MVCGHDRFAGNDIPQPCLLLDLPYGGGYKTLSRLHMAFRQIPSVVTVYHQDFVMPVHHDTSGGFDQPELQSEIFERALRIVRYYANILAILKIFQHLCDADPFACGKLHNAVASDRGTVRKVDYPIFIIYEIHTVELMKNTAREIARSLLQIKAIKLSPANFFTWASGWHSPIYCDNRATLSYPEVRKQIYDAFAELIAEKYPQADVIAGVATGAIAHGVLVAEKMGKPFIYVRSAPKNHGLSNQVEGVFEKGARVVVVEDLVSTGGSSLNAVEALRDAGCEVLGMTAIFTYGFRTAEENFAKAGITLDTLSNYNTMIELAAEDGYVGSEDLATLREWRTDPANWKK